MQDESNGPRIAGDLDKAERLVLLLITDSVAPSLWCRREIALALDGVDVEDAIAGLHASGLAHLLDRFVIPSQASLRVRHLLEPPNG